MSDPVKTYRYPGRTAQIARVTAFVQKWRKAMDLEHVEIGNVFSDIAHGEESGNSEDDAAITNSQWEYRQATITWYLPAVASMNDKSLEDCVVHELCHVLLGPLKEHLKAGSIKQEELATENVARAILRSARG